MEYKIKKEQTLILTNNDVDVLGLLLDSYDDHRVLNKDEQTLVNDFVERFMDVTDDGRC